MTPSAWSIPRAAEQVGDRPVVTRRRPGIVRRADPYTASSGTSAASAASSAPRRQRGRTPSGGAVAPGGARRCLRPCSECQRQERDADEGHGGELGSPRRCRRVSPKRSAVVPARECPASAQASTGRGAWLPRPPRPASQAPRARARAAPRRAAAPRAARRRGLPTASGPQPGRQQQQREERQRAGARQQQVALVVPVACRGCPCPPGCHPAAAVPKECAPAR